MIGGGGVRTPLVIHGLAQAQRTLGVEEFSIFDADPEGAEVMARLGREIVKRQGGEFDITCVAPTRARSRRLGHHPVEHSCWRYGRSRT